MSAEIPTGPRPEQGLNTKSELDPKPVVTFVYRGENPYMRFLVNGFKTRGVPTIVREVSSEEFGEYAKVSKEEDDPKQASLKTLIGLLQGVVVSDMTFDNVFRHFLRTETPFGHPEISAYDVLDWGEGGEKGIVATLRPVIEQITSNGKKPVALQTHLGDHIRIKLDPDEREQLRPIEKEINPRLDDQVSKESGESASIYAAILKKNFDVPVISSSTFAKSSQQTPENPDIARFIELNGREKAVAVFGKMLVPEAHPNPVTIIDLLGKMGVPVEKTVLLLDHNTERYINHNEIRALSEKGVEVALICPCCLVLNVDREFGFRESGMSLKQSELRQKSFKKMGARVFPIERPEPDDKLIERLMDLVQKKRPEIPTEETQDESVELTQNKPGSDTKPVTEEPNPAPKTEPQAEAEKERMSFLRRTLGRFGSKK